MKNNLKQSGITLVALVVTIIILLILAGVAINVALGDNGLFKKSKEAVNTWKSAETNETEILGQAFNYISDEMTGGSSHGKRKIIINNIMYGDESYAETFEIETEETVWSNDLCFLMMDQTGYQSRHEFSVGGEIQWAYAGFVVMCLETSEGVPVCCGDSINFNEIYRINWY